MSQNQTTKKYLWVVHFSVDCGDGREIEDTVTVYAYDYEGAVAKVLSYYPAAYDFEATREL